MLQIVHTITNEAQIEFSSATLCEILEFVGLKSKETMFSSECISQMVPKSLYW